MCQSCQGRGRKSRSITKKAKRNFQRKLDLYKQGNKSDLPPPSPKGHLDACSYCNGSGLVQAIDFPKVDCVRYPHLAIIGAGIGGIALAVACRHRGIPFTLYERDTGFEARAQGYGLTLQQASNFPAQALGTPAHVSGTGTPQPAAR